MQTSYIEISEVSAASRTDRKKVIVTTLLSSGAEAPMSAKMNGRVSKTRPGPACGSSPAAKTAGITTKPAISAKPRSKTAVQAPVETMLSFFPM